MANHEQIAILQQDVAVWNEWRQTHLDEEINLAEVNFDHANLRGAHLDGANLRNAKLERVNLEDGNLQGVDLRDANLQGAHLQSVNLEDANLQNANLQKANLEDANLWSVCLQGANLVNANLENVNLGFANLQNANLQNAHLWFAKLSKANLQFADLRGADLWNSDLESANLQNADLRFANLLSVDLRFANLRRANLTGVRLFAAAKDHWQIDGVLCNYVFWDEKPHFFAEEKEQKKQWEMEHRTPEDRDFRPGEFEELYKQLPTFEYAFEHGFTALDTVVMDRIVAAINEQHPEFELKLDSFHSRGQPHATFTVLHKEYVDVVKSQVTIDYESRIKVLEGQKDQLMDVIKMLGSGGITIHKIQGGVNISQIAGNLDGDIVAGNKNQRAITAG